MLYVGIDYPKRYTQVNVIDQTGKRKAHVRLPNDLDPLQRFFHSLEERCAAALEAGWNWGVLYDWVERIKNVEEIQLAHPYRTRAIAAAQVKTDSIDADTLSQLIRVGLIPQAHIPGADTRRLREIVRQRLFLVRLRTMVKNRLHALLDRYHVPVPEGSDLFGKKGRKYLTRLVLPQPAQPLLTQDLRMLELLDGEIEQTERWLQEHLKGGSAPGSSSRGARTGEVARCGDSFGDRYH